MIQQRTSTWFQQRCGFATGSHANDILAVGGKAKRETYWRAKLGELLSGVAIQPNFVSPEMLIGIEREPLAKAAYEQEEGVMVEEVGFLTHPTIARCGGSCDGLVGDDGIIEIKCGKTGTHAQWWLDQRVPDQHVAQIDFYLAVTGRKWCDFVSYHPDVPRPMRLMVVRRERNETTIGMIESAVLRFNGELDAAVERLRALAGHFDLPAAMQEERPKQDDAPEAWLQDSDFAGLV